MSKAAKATEPATFEDAMTRLESIVETMETGDLPLEQLLARYEEGTRLVQMCQERLDAADLRIQKLDPAPDGEPVAEDFDPGPVGDPTGETPE